MSTVSLQNQVSPDEWALRCDLAAAYRLVAMYGWSDLVFTHISARVPGPEHLFLINPYGLLFDEITPSSLIKVDAHCRPQHDTPHPVNPAGFVIHSCIHAARVDVGCVLHTHSRAGVAVSAQCAGLLPISQQASVVLASLARHRYEGIALRPDEQPRLVADLGDRQFLLLDNHGLLTVGASVADAWLAMYTFENACRIQVDAQAGGGELIAIAPQVLAFNAQALTAVTAGQGAQIAWPALLRRLDRLDPGWRR